MKFILDGEVIDTSDLTVEELELLSSLQFTEAIGRVVQEAFESYREKLQYSMMQKDPVEKLDESDYMPDEEVSKGFQLFSIDGRPMETKESEASEESDEPTEPVH